MNRFSFMAIREFEQWVDLNFVQFNDSQHNLSGPTEG